MKWLQHKLLTSAAATMAAPVSPSVSSHYQPPALYSRGGSDGFSGFLNTFHTCCVTRTITRRWAPCYITAGNVHFGEIIKYTCPVRGYRLWHTSRGRSGETFIQVAHLMCSTEHMQDQETEALPRATDCHSSLVPPVKKKERRKKNSRLKWKISTSWRSLNNRLCSWNIHVAEEVHHLQPEFPLKWSGSEVSFRQLPTCALA